MAGSTKASARPWPEPEELHGFAGCHPFETALQDDDEEEEEEEEEQKEEKEEKERGQGTLREGKEDRKWEPEMGETTLFEQNGPGDRGEAPPPNGSGGAGRNVPGGLAKAKRDLIRDAQCCLQVTLPSRFLCRPTPFGSDASNVLTEGYSMLVALWWAIASHPQLQGSGLGSGGIPHSVKAISVLTNENKQVVGHSLWLWINRVDFNMCRFVNKLLKHQGQYQTPEDTGCDSEDEDEEQGGAAEEAGEAEREEGELVETEAEEDEAKGRGRGGRGGARGGARGGSGGKGRSSRAKTRPPFTKCPLVLAYRRYLRQACETLERYTSMVKYVRIPRDDGKVRKCLRDSAGGGRVRAGTVLDPAVFMSPQYMRFGLPADVLPEQVQYSSYFRAGEGFVAPWPNFFWRLPGGLPCASFANLRLPLPRPTDLVEEAPMPEEELLADLLGQAGDNLEPAQLRAEARRLAQELRPASGGGAAANEATVRRMMAEGRARIQAEVAAKRTQRAWDEEESAHYTWLEMQKLRRRVEPLVLSTLGRGGGCSDAQAAAWEQVRKGRLSPFTPGLKLPPSFYSYQALPVNNLGVADCQLVRLNTLLEAIYRGPLNEEFQVCLAAAQTAGAVGTFFHLLMYGPPGTGKSHLHQLLTEHCLLQGAVRAQLGMSAKALAGNFNFIGQVTVMDELPKHYRGNHNPNMEEDDKTEMIKAMLWSRSVGFSYMRTDQDTGQRFHEYTQAQVSGSHLVNTNTHPSRFAQPLRDRFHTRYVPGRVRPGCEAWRNFAGDGDDEEAEARRHALARWVRDNGALITLYYYLQSLGFVSPVKLHVTSTIMEEFCVEAMKKGVRRLNLQRFIHRLCALIKLVAIRRAIEIVFHSSVSPLIDPALGTDHGLPLGRPPSLVQFAFLEPFLNDEDPSVIMQAVGLLAPQELQQPQQRQVLYSLAEAFFGRATRGEAGGPARRGGRGGGDTRSGLYRASDPADDGNGHYDDDDGGGSGGGRGGGGRPPYKKRRGGGEEAEEEEDEARAWAPEETKEAYKSPFVGECTEALPVTASDATQRRYLEESKLSRGVFEKNELRLVQQRRARVEALGLVREGPGGNLGTFLLPKQPPLFPEPNDFAACRKKLLQLAWQNRPDADSRDYEEYRHVLDLLQDENERPGPGGGAVIKQTRDYFEIPEGIMLWGLWQDLLQRLMLLQLQRGYGRPRQLLTGQTDYKSTHYNLTVVNLLPDVFCGSSTEPRARREPLDQSLQTQLNKDPAAFGLYLRDKALAVRGNDERHAAAAAAEPRSDYADYVYCQHHKELLLPRKDLQRLSPADRLVTLPDHLLLKAIHRADKKIRTENARLLRENESFAGLFMGDDDDTEQQLHLYSYGMTAANQTLNLPLVEEEEEEEGEEGEDNYDHRARRGLVE